MSPDLIDDLLDRSAPATRAADAAHVDAMIADAEQHARPRRPRRRVTIGIAAGVAALFVAGGGVAFASGLIDWQSRYESPDASYPVTLPSGRQCEVRIIAVGAEDNDRTSPQASAELKKWLSDADLVSGLDLTAARAEDARQAAESPDQTVVIGPEGWLMDSPQKPGTRSADDVYAHIVDIAVRTEVLAEVGDLGLDLRTSTFNGGIRCETAGQ